VILALAVLFLSAALGMSRDDLFAARAETDDVYCRYLESSAYVCELERRLGLGNHRDKPKIRPDHPHEE
jgi:hypothetical protein